MALLIKAEELKGLISIPEAVAAVRAASATRARSPPIPRRASASSTRTGASACTRAAATGCEVAGMFIHVERFTFKGGAQQYEKAGKRVYVAYDSETAELKTHHRRLAPAVRRAGGGLVRHRDADHRRGRHRHPGAARLPRARALRHRPAGAAASRHHVHHPPVDRGGARVQPQRRQPRGLRGAHAAAGERAHHRSR